MAIFKKGKHWYIDYYVKGVRKRKKVGPSKKLAEKVLQDVLIKIAKGEYLGIYEDRKLPFEQYAKQYLDYSKANKAPATYWRHDRFNIARLVEAFSGRYLFEIIPQRIEKYKVKRLATVSPATVNRELATLKHMFTKAMQWGYVKANPVKQVKFFKEPPGRLRYLRADEVQSLLNACSSYLRSIIIMALNTGMRKSEILNLRWEDVDLRNKKIKVMNAKNNEVRVIPINQTLYNELASLAKSSEEGYIFSDGNDKPFKSVQKGFIAALRRANIKDFRFHDLRHTFGSHLVMQGVDLKTVQQVMGHKDIKMTMRYSHLSPEYVQEAIERLDKSWTLYGHQKVHPVKGELVNH